MLMTEPKMPVIIVESEKTAIIASVYFPNILWLATGGKQALKSHLFSVLRGRTVVLLPDNGAGNEWRVKADAICQQYPDVRLEVADLLEGYVDMYGSNSGVDIADILITLDLNFVTRGEKR